MVAGTGTCSIKGNGCNNTASGNFSFIGGGCGNSAIGENSFVGGGFGNTALCNYSGVFGYGITNTQPCTFMSNNFVVGNFVGCGGCTLALDINGKMCVTSGGGGVMVAGTAIGSIKGIGCNNTATGVYSFVGGGECNTASEACSFIGGGKCNTASGGYSFIGGGCGNTTLEINTVVGGGYINTACSILSSIVGGLGNAACGDFSFIGGGCNNTTSGYYSTISGGKANRACGCFSTIGGGFCNTASTHHSSVLNGCNNQILCGSHSTIIGGLNNTICGCFSTVGGDAINVCNAACYSSAFGCGLTASAPRTFYVNNMCVCGTLSKTSGSFKIPHPDPIKAETGKFLKHSFVESPTAGDNIYRFSVTTSNCSASIELPDYYSLLNANDHVYVNAKKHLGYGFGVVNDEQTRIDITTNTDGEYNVLLIGTRKDKLALDAWNGTEVNDVE